MQNQSEAILRYDGYHKVTFGTFFPEYIEDHILNMEILGFLTMFTALEKLENLQARSDLYAPMIEAIGSLNKCKNFFNPPSMTSCMRPKHALIKKLEQFDQEILGSENETYKANRLVYGACQAIWASQIENAE